MEALEIILIKIKKVRSRFERLSETCWLLFVSRGLFFRFMQTLTLCWATLDSVCGT